MTVGLLTLLVLLPLGGGVAALAMGRGKDAGTLQPGKLGNLLIVNGRPLERISDLRQVRTVIADARIYDPAALWKAIGFRP